MTTVGDVLELAYGKALKAEARTGGTVPVVGSGGIVGFHSVAITEGPTIVVGRKGSIGSVTWIDGPAWPIDTAYYVKAKERDLDLRWTYWMLNSLPLASMNKSAAVPGLNRDDVYRLPVSVPSAAEQQRIAAILDRANVICGERRQVLNNLDRLRASIFEEMFGAEPWSATLRDLVDVKIGPFGSLLHHEDYVAGGVPLVNPMHIRDGALQPDPEFATTEAKAAGLAQYRLRRGDVVLGRRGEMGRAGIAFEEHEGMLCGTGSLILRPRQVQTVFLHAAVTSPRMKAHFERTSLGATMPNLNRTLVEAAPLPRPSKSAQLDFSARIDRVERLKRVTNRELTLNDKLFASLQARAFRGEL